MAVASGTPPIDQGELLYRRVPESQGWYDSTADQPLRHQAFMPNKGDSDGISLLRERYVGSIEQAAHGKPGKAYRVVAIHASAILERGLTIKTDFDFPDCDSPDPAHVCIPELRFELVDSDDTRSHARALAVSLQFVTEPFLTPVVPQPPNPPA